MTELAGSEKTSVIKADDRQRRKAARTEYRNRKRFARLLYAIRKSRGLSKEELAKRAGYDNPGAITGFENARKSPSYEKVKDLANALDVSIDQLKGYSKIKMSSKGWPVLTDSEILGLYLFAPILESMSDKDIDDLIDFALRCLKTSGRDPAWKQTDQQAKKAAEEKKEKAKDKQNEIIAESTEKYG